MESLIKFKDDERHDAWVAGGHKGPAPERIAESNGPPEFGTLPDVREMAGVRIV